MTTTTTTKTTTSTIWRVYATPRTFRKTANTHSSSSTIIRARTSFTAAFTFTMQISFCSFLLHKLVITHDYFKYMRVRQSHSLAQQLSDRCLVLFCFVHDVEIKVVVVVFFFPFSLLQNIQISIRHSVGLNWKCLLLLLLKFSHSNHFECDDFIYSFVFISSKTIENRIW